MHLPQNDGLRPSVGSHSPRPLARPPAALAWIACGLAVLIWGVIRLGVFREMIMPLSYTVPLLIALWTRDKRMLWGMAGVFAVFATLKTWWILPDPALSLWQDWATYLAQVISIGVAAAIIDLVLSLRVNLEQRNQSLSEAYSELEATNEDLAAREEEIRQQNEELRAQAEELAQQNEELRVQGEELEQQSEELNNQADELLASNRELAYREEILQTILSAQYALAAEDEALARICQDGLRLLGGGVSGALIAEARGDELRVHATVGISAAESESVPPLPLHQSLAGLVMHECRTAALDELSLRPDLVFAASSNGAPFQSVLAAPVKVRGRSAGAIEFYSTERGPWTQDQFRLAEWVALLSGALLERTQIQEELKDSEGQLRLMADAIPQLAWMATPDGWIHWYNQRWYEYTGATAAQMEGWGWQSVHDPDVLPSVLEGWRRSIATGEPFEMTFPLRGADGQFRRFLTRVQPLKSSDGRVRQWFGTNTDVEELKRVEEQLSAARASAERASLAKDQFLAMLSHELRTPLNPALMASTIVERHPQLPEELRETVGIIRRNVELEARLIDDMLDLTRVARGKVTLARRVVDGCELVRHAIHTCEPGAVEAGLKLELHLPKEPVYADADPARLQQVFWNLLQNAIKFTPADGRITVTVSKAADGGLQVEVRDTGKGIARETLERIFNAFEQGGDSVTQRYGGLGLGLAICKGLVALHDGTISAHSDGPGKGATFVVRLPAAASLPAARPAARSNAHAGKHLPDASRSRILLVDDHADTAAVTARLLESFGHDVTTADCVRDALAKFEQHGFDLLVSDLGLPDGSGFDLVRRLSAARPVKAIALSGYGMESDVQESIRAGFAEHLTKPIDVHLLEVAVSRALGQFGALSVETRASV